MNRLLLPALLVLVSCTTNQTAVLPPLPEVEAHVISGAPVRRSIASTTDASILEADFQQVLSSDDVEKQSVTIVDRVGRIFYRTQGLLNDFDAKLFEISKKDTGGEIMLDDSYARMTAAWSVREETLAKVRYFYARSLGMEQRFSDGSQVAREMQSHAVAMNRAIRQALQSSPNSTGRLAKQDLIETILRANADFRASVAEGADSALVKRTDEFSAVLAKQHISDGDEMQTFYVRNANQLTRETVKARADQDISAEIEKMVPEMKRHLQAQFEQRVPQSRGAVRPGVGRSGMLNGTEFAPGVWSLTYDDGPHPTYTLQNLANLNANGLKATFFWVADNVERMHSIVSTVRDAGMIEANHSFTHAQLTKLGPAGLKHEIEDAYRVDVAAGYTPKFFRCPYGACGSQTSAVRRKIADLDMVSVTWNVDSLDWQDKNPSSVYTRVKRQMAAAHHGIILFHDIHPQSVVASKMVMADFVAGQKTGKYRIVTVEQAYNELNSSEGMK